MKLRRHAPRWLIAGGGLLMARAIAFWVYGFRLVGRVALTLPSRESESAISGAALSVFHGEGSVSFLHTSFQRALSDPGDAQYYRQRWSLDYSRWSVEHLAPDKMPRRFAIAVDQWRFCGLGLYSYTRQGEHRRIVELPFWLIAGIGLGVAFTGWRSRLSAGRTARRGVCQSCGYDLTGNVSGRCPECGEAAVE